MKNRKNKIICRIAVGLLMISLFLLSGCADNYSDKAGKIEYYYEATEIENSDSDPANIFEISPETTKSDIDRNPESDILITESITDVLISETTEQIITTYVTEKPETDAITHELETEPSTAAEIEEITTAETVLVTTAETENVPPYETLIESEAIGEEKQEYLLNTNTKKFHLLTCKSGQKTKEENRAYHKGTKDEIISQGYSPCKNCKP